MLCFLSRPCVRPPSPRGQARGLTSADVGAAARRLRLYRRLRRLDPAAFWQLLRPGSRTVLQSRVRARREGPPGLGGGRGDSAPGGGGTAPLVALGAAPRALPLISRRSMRINSCCCACFPSTPLLVQAPSRLLLTADYLLSLAANLAVAAAAYGLWWGSSTTLAPPAVAAAGAAALLWAVVAQWLRARPTAGALFGEQLR